MTLRKLLKNKLLMATVSTALIVSCAKLSKQEKPLIINEDATKAVAKAKEIREKTPIKLTDGVQMTLWASDSLAIDPVAMSIDDLGRVYLIRTNRQKTLSLIFVGIVIG